MEFKKVERPVVGRRTMVGQAFDECFKDYPILLQNNGKKN